MAITINGVSLQMAQPGSSPMGGMSMTTVNSTTPFDKAFIDAMIPHHQMAIKAAELELAHGTHARLRSLALSIIEDQAREIGLMQAYSDLWYGGSGMGHMGGMSH